MELIRLIGPDATLEACKGITCALIDGALALPEVGEAAVVASRCAVVSLWLGYLTHAIEPAEWAAAPYEARSIIADLASSADQSPEGIAAWSAWKSGVAAIAARLDEAAYD